MRRAYGETLDQYKDKRYFGRTSTRRTAMLNMHREQSFKADVNEILMYGRVEEKHQMSIRATIISKASRDSIDAAKEYIRVKQKENILSKETADALSNLLDRYSTWR